MSKSDKHIQGDKDLKERLIEGWAARNFNTVPYKQLKWYKHWLYQHTKLYTPAFTLECIYTLDKMLAWSSKHETETQ